MSWERKRQRPLQSGAKNSRRALAVCNVLSWVGQIFLLFGLAMIILCLVIIYDKNLSEVCENLQLFGSYRLGLLIAICIAIAVCIVSLLGCCVTWHQTSKGLLVYSVICLLFVIGEITVMVLVFKYTSSNKMTEILAGILQKIILKMKFNKTQAIRFMENLQGTLRCCGGFSLEDYTQQEMDLPESCYFFEANVYNTGCAEMLVRHFNANSLAVGLIAVAILLLQISLIWCSCSVFFSKRELRKRLAASKV